jgi:hypothetical protein
MLRQVGDEDADEEEQAEDEVGVVDLGELCAVRGEVVGHGEWRSRLYSGRREYLGTRAVERYGWSRFGSGNEAIATLGMTSMPRFLFVFYAFKFRVLESCHTSRSI